eukprot:GHVN01089260.1.p1 GENE.GHVN01089260.1~~GHVN01089260.1.p1  ORF type:complete len:157 (+),score=7.70 GHVN01089260.1:626-1096(+)
MLDTPMHSPRSLSEVAPSMRHSAMQPPHSHSSAAPPTCAINPRIIRWKIEFLKCKGFPLGWCKPASPDNEYRHCSRWDFDPPVHNWRKFSAVFGTVSLKSTISTRLAGASPTLMSRYTRGSFDSSRSFGTSGISLYIPPILLNIPPNVSFSFDLAA